MSDVLTEELVDSGYDVDGDDDELQFAAEDYDGAVDDDDDDDDDEEFQGGLEGQDDDDDHDEEFLGALLSAALPAVVSGISKLVSGRGGRKRVSRARIRTPRTIIRGRSPSIMTRRGRIRLGGRFVTASNLNRLLSNERRASRRNSNILSRKIRSVDRNAIKRSTGVRRLVGRTLQAERKERIKSDRKLNKQLNKKIDDMKQMNMLLTLLQSPPQIKSFVDEDGNETKVSTTTYNDSGMNPLLMMTLMGDGMGDNSMLPLLLLGGI